MSSMESAFDHFPQAAPNLFARCKPILVQPGRVAVFKTGPICQSALRQAPETAMAYLRFLAERWKCRFADRVRLAPTGTQTIVVGGRSTDRSEALLNA